MINIDKNKAIETISLVEAVLCFGAPGPHRCRPANAKLGPGAAASGATAAFQPWLVQLLLPSWHSPLPVLPL